MRRQKVTAKPPADPEREHVATYVGYARVSTADQNIDMQVAALVRAGVHPDNIHQEHVSGVHKRRPERDVIAERTAHGMASAKARGQTFGAPPKVTEEVERDVVLLIGEGWTMREIANKHKLHVNTLRKRFGAARLQEIRDAAERAKRKRKRD